MLNGGVVGTQMSNLGLERALMALGVPFLRAPVGDRYVLERMQQEGWMLGGETSGHIICLDRTSTGDASSPPCKCCMNSVLASRACGK